MKIQPSVQTIAVKLPPYVEEPGVTAVDSTMDTSQCASILNRRFYRQGINWVVSGFRILKTNPTTSGSPTIVVSRLPNSWSMSNGWEKTFRAWNKQQREAIEDSGSQSAMAAFRDFKIHMDVTHVTQGFASNLLPYDSDGNVATPGEWEPSQIVVPNLLPDGSGSTVDPAEYTLHAVGINNNGGQSRGIIEGYENSRAYPQSPDPVSPFLGGTANWLRQMFDVGNDTSEVIENATTRNDELPYDQVNYPGGQTQLPGLQVVDVGYFSTGTNSNKLYLKGDNFPCGLVRFTHNVPEGLTVLVDLVPGQHKGYLCQPMTEM